jgi:hypothetical protein
MWVINKARSAVTYYFILLLYYLLWKLNALEVNLTSLPEYLIIEDYTDSNGEVQSEVWRNLKNQHWHWEASSSSSSFPNDARALKINNWDRLKHFCQKNLLYIFWLKMFLFGTLNSLSLGRSIRVCVSSYEKEVF